MPLRRQAFLCDGGPLPRHGDDAWLAGPIDFADTIRTFEIVNAGLPGIAAFDLAALRVPIGRSGRTLRIWCAGLRSMKLRSISSAPASARTKRCTARRRVVVKRGTAEALLAGRQIQTAKLKNPYWEATFAEPRQFDSILIKAGKNFDITRLYTLKIEIDGELVYDNLGLERAEQKVGNFLVRAQGVCHRSDQNAARTGGVGQGLPETGWRARRRGSQRRSPPRRKPMSRR